MPESGRIYLAPELFIKITELAKSKLKQEANLTDVDIDKDNAFWEKHFSTFKESVRKKSSKRKPDDSLSFPEKKFFYKRRREAELDKLGGLERHYFKLLLIQCDFDTFEDVFYSNEIPQDAKAKQFSQPNLYTQPSLFPSDISLPNNNQAGSDIDLLLDRYADTKWWFYFYGFNNNRLDILVRLKFFIRKKENGEYPIELVNTKEEFHHHYTGFIRREVCTQNIMVCELKTKATNARLLHLKFVIYDSVPEILIGTYSNYEGTRLIAGSIIMQKADANFDKQEPKSYYYIEPKKKKEKTQEDKSELEKSDVPEVIKAFFRTPLNNSVKLPSKVLKRLRDLKDWKNEKEDKQIN